MPKKYGNRIKVNSATTGTGVISLGTAVEGYQNFSSGGITDGSSVSYVIEDGANFEIGVGTYTASGDTLSRTVSESTNSNNAINLSGEAVIFITPAASDLPFTDGASFSGAVTFAEDVTFDGATAGRDIVFDRSDNSLEFSDNAKAKFGTGADLQIYHSVDSLLDNSTNDLFIRNLADDKDIIIQTDNGSGGTATYFRADGSTGAVELSHYGSTKIATTSTGVNVTGTVTDDGAVHDGDVTFTGASYSAVWDKSENALAFAASAKATFGSALTINTTNLTYNQSGSGNFQVISNKDIDMKVSNQDRITLRTSSFGGQVELYNAGSKKFETSSTGVTVTGNIVVSGTVDGRDVATDGTKLDGITAGADVTPSWVPSSDPSYIGAAGGTFTGDVIYQGSNANIEFDVSNDALEVKDNARIIVGNGDDMMVYHNGTNYIDLYGNTYIRNTKADSYTFLEADNGSGSPTSYVTLNGVTGEVQLSHYGSQKLATKSTGVQVTGTIMGDRLDIDNVEINGGTITGQTGALSLSGNVTIENGTLTAQDDVTFTGANYNAVWDKSDNALEFASGATATFGGALTINATNLTYNQSGSGNFQILSNKEMDFKVSSQDRITLRATGAVDLYYSTNGKKFATTSSGVDVTGNIVVSGTVDGRDVAADGTKLDGIAAGANVGIPTTGGTFTGDVTFNEDLLVGQNDKLWLGYSSGNSNMGLQLFHGGTSATIENHNFVTTYKSDGHTFKRHSTDREYMTLNEDTNHTVSLKAAGSTRLQTSGTGVTVTGTLAATAVTGDGSGLTNLPAGASNVGTANFIGGTNAGANLESGAQENTILGNNAGNDVTSGRYNTLVGKDAGPLLTTAQANTFVGWQSGLDTTGGANTFLGYRAGRYATTGISNVFVGYETGDGNFGTANTGQYNTAIGSSALGGISSGQNNVAVGYTAGDNITSGSRNIVIGQGADASSATISNEITIGSQNHTRFRLPGVQHNAANGSVLQYNSATGLIGLSALQTDLVYDTSPQLGGNLDANGYDINVDSNDYLNFGSFLSIQATSGGYARITTSTSANAFELKGDYLVFTSVTGNEDYLKCTYNGSVKLYYDNSAKFETSSSGVTISGTATATSFSGSGANLTNLPFPSNGGNISTGSSISFADNADLKFGTAEDLIISHENVGGEEFNRFYTINTMVTRFQGNYEFGHTSGGSGGDVTFKGASCNVVWDRSDNALEFADDAKATFGAGSDLQIYHDGTNSFVKDNGSGDLILDTNGDSVRITNTSNGETMARFQKNNKVELYYDNAIKLATTSTGITVTGDVNSTSDIRAKKNIETIEGALEKVSLLRGVTFDWDNDVEERATGVIAQDVEKVLPEAVRDNAETGFKSVAYGNMVGLLVEAIKEQQTQIDELKDKIKKLNG